jgi:hypothetical protein
VSEYADWRGWQPAPTWGVAAPEVFWRRESVMFGLVTVFSTLLGGAVGPVWQAVAPRLNLVSANDGSAAATKLLIGDDLWFGLVAILAGAVCVALLMLAAPRTGQGPGAVVGLAVGGLLGAIVAAHIGHQIGNRQMTRDLAATFPHARASGIRAFLSYYDFRVRARAVLIGWPVAALACLGLVSLAAMAREKRRLAPANYPGSS